MAGSERPLPPGAATTRRRAIAWQAEVRPLMIELRDQGMSYQQIADVLNQRGLRTRLRARWTPDGVRKVINHPVM